MKTRRSLEILAFCFMIYAAGFNTKSNAQGIPVIDATTIASLATELTELQRHFDNMVANTNTPERFLWASVQQQMGQLVQISNAISQIKNQYGGLDKVLANFRNYAYYRMSPCIVGQALCSDAAWQEIIQGQVASTDIIKKGNDALAKGIENQETQIPLDAQHLETLQQRTTTASGRMEALQYANQLAAHQANQLLQLRQLMLAQVTAEEAKNQAENDKMAIQQATKAEMTKRLSPQTFPPGKTWRVSDRF